MKTRSLALIISFLAIAFFWNSFLHEEGSSLPAIKSIDTKSPSEQVRRFSGTTRTREKGELSNPKARREVMVRVVDGVTQDVQHDCCLAIEKLGLKLTSKQMEGAISFSEKTFRTLMEFIEKKTARELASVFIESQAISLNVRAIRLRTVADEDPFEVEIVVDRFSKITVGIIGLPDRGIHWQGKVSLCPPIPENLTPRRQREALDCRRLPRTYRKKYGRNVKDDFRKVEKAASLESELEFIVDQPSEYFVECRFDEKFRGTGQIIRLERGESHFVSLKPVPIPIVSGMLLDTGGVPVPNQRVRIRGEAALPGGEIFVAKNREGRGYFKVPGGPMTFSVTTSVMTNEVGQFEVPITISGTLTFEAYVKEKGKIAKSVRVPSSDSDLRGIILQLQEKDLVKKLVKLVAPNGEDLRYEKIKLVRVDGKPSYYSPVVGVDGDGWLDTRWLFMNGQYRGMFDSNNFRHFFFRCTHGEEVRLEIRKQN